MMILLITHYGQILLETWSSTQLLHILTIEVHITRTRHKIIFRFLQQYRVILTGKIGCHPAKAVYVGQHRPNYLFLGGLDSEPPPVKIPRHLCKAASASKANRVMLFGPFSALAQIHAVWPSNICSKTE